MKIEKVLLLICCLGFSSFSFGQQKLAVHEIGLSISGGLDFALLYKVGKPKSLFRLRTLFLEGTNYEDNVQKFTSNGIGFSLGVEFRKKIINQIYFLYGFDAGLNYSLRTNSSPGGPKQLTSVITPNVNLVLGLSYILKKRWIFSIELMPYFAHEVLTTYEDLIEDKRANNTIYGLDLSSVQLVVAYRFLGKKKAS